MTPAAVDRGAVAAAATTVFGDLVRRAPLAVGVADGEWLLGAPGPVRRRCGELIFAAQDEGTLDLAEALWREYARAQDLEQQQEALFEELGTSYESLSCIYEIGSDPSLLLCPDRALAKIIDRALAFEADLRAVFWLVCDGEIAPAQWRHTERPCARDAGHGLVGRALMERRGIIVNRRDGGDGDEPELREAARIAVSPMICREEPIGALVVWHDAPGEFDSRLMGLLTSLSSQAAMILEQDRLRQETVEGERLRQEIEIGGTIQQILLSGRAPAPTARLEVGTITEASRQIDGDFIDFFRHDESTLDVLVADVMGKGIPAALVGAAVKSQFLRFASTNRADGGTLPPAPPGSIVAAVHAEVAPHLIELQRFVTAVYARFDARARTMTYVDCGHTHTLHYRAAAGRVEPLAEDVAGRVNLPLGMVPDTTYRERTIPCEDGDVFVFYSDGATEARNADGAMFGPAGLARALRDHHALPAQRLAAALAGAVTGFAGDGGLDDDLTCVVVRIPGRAPAALSLTVPAVPGHLAAVRAFVAEACALVPGAPFAADAVARYQLAVTEAMTNIVRHAYAKVEGDIALEASRDANALVFRLRDRGRPFDPSAAPPPTLDGSTSGGFGIFIIRQIFDTFSYSRDDAGVNCLELVARIPTEGEPHETR